MFVFTYRLYMYAYTYAFNMCDAVQSIQQTWNIHNTHMHMLHYLMWYRFSRCKAFVSGPIDLSLPTAMIEAALCRCLLGYRVPCHRRKWQPRRFDLRSMQVAMLPCIKMSIVLLQQGMVKSTKLPRGLKKSHYEVQPSTWKLWKWWKWLCFSALVYFHRNVSETLFQIAFNSKSIWILICNPNGCWKLHRTRLKYAHSVSNERWNQTC